MGAYIRDLHYNKRTTRTFARSYVFGRLCEARSIDSLHAPSLFSVVNHCFLFTLGGSACSACKRPRGRPRRCLPGPCFCLQAGASRRQRAAAQSEHFQPLGRRISRLSWARARENAQDAPGEWGERVVRAQQCARQSARQNGQRSAESGAGAPGGAKCALRFWRPPWRIGKALAVLGRSVSCARRGPGHLQLGHSQLGHSQLGGCV